MQRVCQVPNLVSGAFASQGLYIKSLATVNRLGAISLLSLYPQGGHVPPPETQVKMGPLGAPPLPISSSLSLPPLSFASLLLFYFFRFTAPHFRQVANPYDGTSGLVSPRTPPDLIGVSPKGRRTSTED